MTITERKRATLAKRFLEALAENPDATAQELAEANEVSVEQVGAILDSYLVEDGKATHVGPGRGGGWVSE